MPTHLQPLLRFDIGDRIALGGQRCACDSALPVIEVEGRSSDEVLVVAAAGGTTATLLPLAQSTLLEDEAGVFAFQLRQKGRRTLRLSLGPRAASVAGVAAGCHALLAGYAAEQGARGLRVIVEQPATLPPARGGKLARIVAAKARPRRSDRPAAVQRAPATATRRHRITPAPINPHSIITP